MVGQDAEGFIRLPIKNAPRQEAFDELAIRIQNLDDGLLAIAFLLLDVGLYAKWRAKWLRALP